MGFEWGERKRRTNLAKHGIDFAELQPLFRGPISDQADNRRAYGEPRSIAVGRLGGLIVSIVYIWRGTTRRIISARRANRHEREDFYRYTAENGRQGSDWDRVRNMTEEEIEAAAASDPDNPPTDREFWRGARTVYPDSPRWEAVPLHLDVDVLKWFKARRFRYQDEINAALRAYMEAHHEED